DCEALRNVGPPINCDDRAAMNGDIGWTVPGDPYTVFERQRQYQRRLLQNRNYDAIQCRLIVWGPFGARRIGCVKRKSMAQSRYPNISWDVDIHNLNHTMADVELPRVAA